MLAALVISGAALHIFVTASRTGVLEIRDTFSGRLYGRWPVDENGGFAIEFIHSVNQSPVRESFRVEDGRLVLESVRFYSFGAGIQSDLGEGQTLSQDGDAMIISGFNVPLNELNLIVGTVSDHLLFINNNVISLRELCGRNAQITIRYR
ncbi:MAG: DUF1850 domain-containing protein [Treponema sp.]|jgi:hypothetical protein|nr:DUF1850 domain-containing protein [Treponema sp.]